MNTYTNPISTRDHQLLTALQEAAVRLYYSLKESRRPSRAAYDALAATHHVVSVALAGEHDDALEDAYFGHYATGDPAIPVLPAGAFGEERVTDFVASIAEPSPAAGSAFEDRLAAVAALPDGINHVTAGGLIEYIGTRADDAAGGDQ